MRQYIRRTRSSFTMVGALALLLTAAACGGGDNAGDALSGDDALGRDLALAGQDSVQPALEDVPEAEAPVVAPVTPTPTPPPTTRPPAARPTTPAPRPVATTPAPAPAAEPAPVVPAEGSIASGSSMRFVTNTNVCTGVTNVGEKFTARLSGSLEGSNGATIPAGSTGTFEVVTAKRAENQNDDTYLTVRLISVTVDGNVYPVQARTESAATTRVRAASSGTDAKKVATGAAIGAIAGRILGKDTKGAVVGAAAGAAAGTAAAIGTADFDTCLNSGAVIAVTLSAPVTVKVGF